MMTESFCERQPTRPSVMRIGLCEGHFLRQGGGEKDPVALSGVSAVVPSNETVDF